MKSTDNSNFRVSGACRIENRRTAMGEVLHRRWFTDGLTVHESLTDRRRHGARKALESPGTRRTGTRRLLNDRQWRSVIDVWCHSIDSHRPCSTGFTVSCHRRRKMVWGLTVSWKPILLQALGRPFQSRKEHCRTSNKTLKNAINFVVKRWTVPKRRFGNRNSPNFPELSRKFSI